MKIQKLWTTDEENYLKQNFMKMSCAEMAKFLGRTTRSVQHRFAQLDLDRSAKVGDNFNNLIIKEIYLVNVGNQMKSKAKCSCKCGNIINTLLTNVVSQHTKSCGCLRLKQFKSQIKNKNPNYKHGMSKSSRIYRIWSAMRCRCNNPNSIGYHNYGGRGIKVHKDWNIFINFYNWSIKNGYTDSLSIDRIDVDGNYEPNNCRWATTKEQCRNRRNNRMDTVKITAFGETKSVIEWINDNRCKINTVNTLCYRIGSGWEPEIAITKESERK
jgi:hypothetical protein